MDFIGMIPILLPIFLFVVSMIITFTLYLRDRKEIRIGSVKKLVDGYISNVDSSKKMLDESIVVMEDRVAKKSEESKSILDMVRRQLDEVKNYSSDLLELKRAMLSYKKSLNGLANLSKEAKAFTISIEEDITRAEQVKELIKSFMQTAKETDAHLDSHRQHIASLQEESIENLKEYVRKIDNDLDGFMEGLNREGEDLLDNFKMTANAEVEAGLSKLDNSFHTVIRTVKEFMAALDEKCIALQNTSELITSSSAETLEQISVRSKELREMSLSLTGAKEEREKVLNELSELQQEKNLLESLLKEKENSTELETENEEITSNALDD